MLQIIHTLTGDGLQLYGLLANTEAKEAIIIHIHGMQANFYTHREKYLDGYPSNGIAFLSGEHRGSYIVKRFATADGGRVIGGAYEVFEECVPDIQAWIDFAEKQGYTNIWLSSSSLGTAKTAFYMQTTQDSRVKGLLLLSPSDGIGLVKDPEGAADHAICLPEAQKLQQEGKGSQLLSHLLWGDKVLSAATYLNLFSEASNSNIYHYYDPGLSWQTVHSIHVPVIAFTGTNDTASYR